MGIEEIHRWQWAVIGAIFGIGLGWLVIFSAGNVDRVQSADAAEFERDVVCRDDASQKPLVTDILVHPAEVTPVTDSPANLVTYQRLAKDKQGRLWWREKYFVATIPYTPIISGRVSADPEMTINTYLAQISRQYDFVDYSTGWWLKPGNAVLVGGIGGALLLGGVWPILLNVMFGAGLGRQRETGGEFSLWKYKPRSNPKKQAARPQPTAADLQRMSDVTHAYEQHLHPAGSGHAAPAPASAAQPTEVKKIVTQSLGEMPKGEDDEVEVKSREYYPVIVHHHKPNDGQELGEHKSGPEKH